MEPEAQDESLLLERIRNGAVDDYAGLVQRHQAHVFRILSRYERDGQLLEDLAQNTFVKAWRAIHQYDGRAPFQHWLARIAVHVAIDHVRARREREVRFTDLGDSALEWLQAPDTSHGPEPCDAREILALAMRALKPEDQLVITLLEIEERSIKEIIALTGWSSVSVRVRAYRARARLKKALEELEERS
jgi:RNA polymerase sigma-70 factor (ECF subfamily)